MNDMITTYPMRHNATIWQQNMKPSLVWVQLCPPEGICARCAKATIAWSDFLVMGHHLDTESVIFFIPVSTQVKKKPGLL